MESLGERLQQQSIGNVRRVHSGNARKRKTVHVRNSSAWTSLRPLADLIGAKMEFQIDSELYVQDVNADKCHAPKTVKRHASLSTHPSST